MGVVELAAIEGLNTLRAAKVRSLLRSLATAYVSMPEGVAVSYTTCLRAASQCTSKPDPAAMLQEMCGGNGGLLSWQQQVLSSNRL